MAIIHPYLGKKKKRKPTAEERELATSWEKLKLSHAKPLELGSQVKGKIPGTLVSKSKVRYQEPEPYKRKNENVPSLPMKGMATKPIADPAAAEKHAMKAHAGVAYNKGGLVFLSDADLAEQRTGVHKRR
jgi:hypothetical protein